MKKKLFITFEGGEGTGKTTLIESLYEDLTFRDFAVIKTREPGGTWLGEKIREILLTKEKVKMSEKAELCLFLAARAQHIQNVILPALDENKIVLCDRFNDSSIAYQGAARGLGMEEVNFFCDFISGNLKPNLTFYLDLDPKIGLQRVLTKDAYDRIEAEEFSFHAKIREAYLILAEKEERFFVLNASLPFEEVYKQAADILDSFL